MLCYDFREFLKLENVCFYKKLNISFSLIDNPQFVLIAFLKFYYSHQNFRAL